MSILYFDGMLGLHIIFALTWIAGTFIGLTAFLKLSKQPGDVSAAKRARTAQFLGAAGGGLTVLVGLGFYYYINFYRTTYATSSSGLPLVDAGAALGFIVFLWQMAMGPRIRKSLRAIIGTTGVTSTAPAPAQSRATGLPKNWMLIAPAILLLLAFVLMIGGSMM
ncbi:MAG: hypothetical protein JRN15_03090 [Nitrososphaerota archaeon]|nr:hypothetical protein [Nitrososphaerota archaeon]